MKKLLVLLAVLTLAVAVSAESWTIIVWLNNQSNLASYGHDDLNEMEVADYSQYGDGVDVICLLGTTGGSYTQNAQLYHVDYDSQSYDGNEGMSHVVSTEINGHGIWSGTLYMDTDIDAFEAFVEWTVANYPADNYLVSAWNHGSGIWTGGDSWLDKGACGDLKIWEFEQALKNAGTYIDVMGYDVCLLGQIETGYQMEDNVVGIQLGSQKTEPAEGWDYEAFTIFETDTNVTPDELAIRVVDDYLSFYGSGQTQAAADVKNWGTIMESDWDTFCHELFDNCYTYESEITSARSSASYYNTSEDRDLYDFVQSIAGNSSLPSSLQTAATSVEDALETYTLAGGMHNSGDPGGGMSIWFPTNGSSNSHWSSYQNNLDFSDTYWDEFLEMFKDPYPVQPVMISVNNVSFDDSAGNNDGKLDPGETITATVTLKNSGTDTAANVNGVLTISDSHFNVTAGNGSYGNIASNATASADFVFEVLSSCPDPYNTNADLAVTANGGYSEALGFAIAVGSGFFDNAEDGDGKWTHGGTADQWHISTEDGYNSDHSWKCGSTGSGDYVDNQNSWIMTTPVFIPTDGWLVFQTKYDLESSYDYVYVEIGSDSKGWTTLDTFNGTQSSWTAESYNLSSYVGQILYLRFRFTSDSSQTREGFYFDNFAVAASGSGVENAELFANAREEGILLSWNAEGDILGYNLLREGNQLNGTLLSSNNYLDASVIAGEEYDYSLEIIDLDGTVNTFGPISAIAMGDAALRTTLGHNYPSPVVSSTVVPFELATDSRVELSVYDLSGRLVETLVSGEMNAGRHSVTWNAEGNAAGIYLLQLKTDEQTVTSRAVISR